MYKSITRAQCNEYWADPKTKRHVSFNALVSKQQMIQCINTWFWLHESYRTKKNDTISPTTRTCLIFLPSMYSSEGNGIDHGTDTLHFSFLSITESMQLSIVHNCPMQKLVLGLQKKTILWHIYRVNVI